MSRIDFTPEVINERKALADHARACIKELLHFDTEDGQTLMTVYQDFYLQISFTQLHPLMVICLMRKIEVEPSARTEHRINELNLKSVLGCHIVNENYEFYYYRSSQWLDAELTETRFFEILSRCLEDAMRGYAYIKS